MAALVTPPDWDERSNRVKWTPDEPYRPVTQDFETLGRLLSRTGHAESAPV